MPAWYGPDPDEALSREYAAAREGAALVDLSDRGVLGVSGPLRQKFLQGVLSNDIAGRKPGQGCLAALLDVKGHVLTFLRALVTKEAVRLEIPGERLRLVSDTLHHYRVAAPVSFAEHPTAVMALLGPLAVDVLRRAGAAGVTALEGAEDHATLPIEGHEALVARGGDLPAAGFVIHALPSDAAPIWEALRGSGATPLGRRALDALRIESGEAWYGSDVTDDHLLHETGLVQRYHSSSKGCYVGQEVVARLEARGGHVSRLLRGLQLAAPAPPGARALLSGKDVGHVTTTGVSPRLGPIALAYVHRSAFEPGTALTVDGISATVVKLPFGG
jgi:folate-binding protein YgfZ